MKRIKILFIFAFLFGYNTSISQNFATEDFNLNFENIEDSLPVQWTSISHPDYSIGLNKRCKYRGKYSAFIESQYDTISRTQDAFKLLKLNIKEPPVGRKITLSGYIKTKNVTGWTCWVIYENRS